MEKPITLCKSPDGKAVRVKPQAKIDIARALEIFGAAPDDALLPPEVVAAAYHTPLANLDKARCIGDDAFPPFVKVGTRVRYRAGTVRAHLRALQERRVS